MRLRLILLLFFLSWFSSNSHATGVQVEMRTNLGNIVLELDADKAPKTVENFLQYVDDGFYKNTIFHRIIAGFMIQGGGYDSAYKEKPTRPPIRNEAANDLKNEIGTIAMARTSDPHSASAQFFINVANNSFLNFKAPNQNGYGYAVFGKVISGMDVVNKIASTSTGTGGPFPSDVPKTKIIIEDVVRLPAATKE